MDKNDFMHHISLMNTHEKSEIEAAKSIAKSVQCMCAQHVAQYVTDIQDQSAAAEALCHRVIEGLMPGGYQVIHSILVER